jgi:hypothetical protein
MLREVGMFGGGNARRNHADECSAQKGPPAEEGPESSHVRSNAVIEFQFGRRSFDAELLRFRWAALTLLCSGAPFHGLARGSRGAW